MVIREMMILVEDGDVSIFRNAYDLEKYVEPVDVRDGSYEIFGADGQIFSPVVRVKERGFWSFSPKLEYVELVQVNGLKEPDRLIEMIKFNLLHLGDSEDFLRELSLCESLERLASKVGFTK